MRFSVILDDFEKTAHPWVRKRAEAGDPLAHEVVKAYDKMYECPGDSRRQLLFMAAYAAYRQAGYQRGGTV